MKKGWIIILIIILSILALSCIGLLVMLIMNHGSLNQDWSFGINMQIFDKNNLQVQKEESFDLTNIQDIHLTLGSSDVHIYKSENTEFRVVQKATQTLEAEELFSSSVSNNRISITENKKIKFHFLFWGTNWYSYDIYVPQNYTGNLNITTSSGNIQLHDSFTFGSLFIKSSSGNITIAEELITSGSTTFETISGDIHSTKSLKANNIVVKASSGDIRFQEFVKTTDTIDFSTISGTIVVKNTITGQSSKISSTSGDIRIAVLELLGDFKISTVSGNIQFDTLQGLGNVHTTSGDIKISTFTIFGNTDINSTSGGVYVGMAEGVNCDIYDKTVSGNVSIPNDVRRMGTEPYCILNLKTVSGNIRVTK